MATAKKTAEEPQEPEAAGGGQVVDEAGQAQREALKAVDPKPPEEAPAE
jgi:hypothetical protein